MSSSPSRLPGPLTFPCPISPPLANVAPQLFSFRNDSQTSSSSSSLLDHDLLHCICVHIVNDSFQSGSYLSEVEEASPATPVSPVSPVLLTSRRQTASPTGSSSGSSSSESSSESESESSSESDELSRSRSTPSPSAARPLPHPTTTTTTTTETRRVARIRCVVGTRSLNAAGLSSTTVSTVVSGILLVESCAANIRLGKMCACGDCRVLRGGNAGDGNIPHCVVFVVPLLVKDKKEMKNRNLFRLRLAWFEIGVCGPEGAESGSEREREREPVLTGSKRGRRKRETSSRMSQQPSVVGPTKKRQKLLIDDEPDDDELDVFYRDTTIVPRTSENPLWLNDPDLVNSGFDFLGGNEGGRNRSRNTLSSLRVIFENRGFVGVQTEVGEDVFACVLSETENGNSRPVVVIDEDTVVVGFGNRVIRARILRDQSGVRLVDVVLWKDLPGPVSCVTIPPILPHFPQVTWGVTPAWAVFSGLRGGETLLHYLVDGEASWSTVAQLWQDSVLAIVFPSCLEEGSGERNEVPVVVGEIGRFVVLARSGDIETCDLGLRSKVDSVVVQDDVVVVASDAGELMAMHPHSKSRHCLDVGGLCRLSSRHGCSEVFGFIRSTNRIAVISGSLSPQALDKMAFSSLERSKRVVPSLLRELAENSVASLESERDLLTSRLHSGNVALRVFRDCPLRWKMFPRLAGGLHPEVHLVVKNEGSSVFPSECWSLSFLLRPDFALLKQHDLVLSFPLPFPLQPGATIRKIVNLRELLVGTYSPIEVRAILSFRWTDEAGSVFARDFGDIMRLIPMIDFVRKLEPGESRPRAGTPLGLPIRLRSIVPSMMGSTSASHVHSFKMKCSEREGQFLPPDGEVRIVTHLGDIVTIVRSRSFIRVQGTSYSAVAAMRHALIVPRLVGDKEGFDADILANPPSNSRQDLADLRSSIDSRRDVLIELLHRLQSVVSQKDGVIDCPAEVLVSEASVEWENLKRTHDELRKILNELVPESPQ